MSQYKMLVFDLDGTLAPLGLGITKDNVNRLKELERRGYQIVLCSGKPTYYLCGLLRQIELQKPVMIGENGATFQFGVNLPPKKYYEYPCSAKARQQIRFFREAIDSTCREKVWYQPNEIELTPFICDPTAFDDIQNIIDHHSEQLTELTVYRHVDCFDFIPNNVNKKNGIRYLGELTGVDTREMISFGDSINDIPMLEETGLSIGIGTHPQLKTHLRFDTITDALEYVLKL